MRTRLLLFATLIASATVCAIAPVSATTTTLPTATLPTTSLSAAAPSDYTSLAAAMVNYYATESGQSLSQWTQANSTQMNSLLGTSATGSTLTQLTNELTNNGAALQLNSVSSPASLLSAISSKSATPDGQATLSGMNLAQSLAGLYSSSAKGASTDSALFGLFYDRSLTNMLTSSPNLFSKIGSSLTSASSQAAWSSAMAKAASSTSLNLAGLPDPCMVGMLTAMGTGKAGGVAGLGGLGCGPCEVAGTFLNTQLTEITNPASNNLLTGNGGVSTSAWSQLQGWLKSGTITQNPGLSQTLNPTSTSNLASCSASSAASQGALTQALPGVFSNLGK